MSMQLWWVFVSSFYKHGQASTQCLLVRSPEDRVVADILGEWRAVKDRPKAVLHKPELVHMLINSQLEKVSLSRNPELHFFRHLQTRAQQACLLMSSLTTLYVCVTKLNMHCLT